MSNTETLNKEIEYLEAIIPFSVKACPTNSLAGYVAPETNAAGVGFAIFSQTKRHFLFLFRVPNVSVFPSAHTNALAPTHFRYVLQIGRAHV